VTRKSKERLVKKTKRSCLMSVGRERSLSFEFIVLQRKVRFTDNQVFEKVGTGSGFWKKNQKPRFKSCVLPIRLQPSDYCGDHDFLPSLLANKELAQRLNPALSKPVTGRSLSRLVN
jgi:hypothetical protein